MKANKCHHCGSKHDLTIWRECGTWGRKMATCGECKANGKMDAAASSTAYSKTLGRMVTIPA